MRQGSRDRLSGGVLLVLSIALYVAIPGQVETLEGDTLTPASFPMAITAIIGVLSAMLLVQGMRAGGGAGASDDGITPIGMAQVGATILLMIAYVALMPWLGYIVATAGTLALLALLYRNRSWKQILLIVVIAPPALLLFFRYAMLVLLPQGRVFG